MPLTVGDQIARITGARPGTVCMHQNVTVAVAVVLSCFRLEPPRNRIVYVEGEFPSVRYLLQAQPGAEIDVVPDLDALVDAIDERTLLAPLSHVLFKTAELQDAEAVQRRADEVGAHVLLDAYQSAGAVPIDLDRLGVAFATGGSVKWLCGGPGAGWLYVRPDLIDELEPAFVGWQGHARPFAFEPELEYADGIARFLTGTPNVPALYAATAGYDVIEEVGVDAIRSRSLELTDLLIRLADDAGLEVTSQRDRARRGASVTVHVPGFEGVHKELAERQILCDFRPDVGLRLGPHFYNSEDELEYAIGQIAEIVSTGAHERHLGAAARF
jgi:kynureninase